MSYVLVSRYLTTPFVSYKLNGCTWVRDIASAPTLIGVARRRSAPSPSLSFRRSLLSRALLCLALSCRLELPLDRADPERKRCAVSRSERDSQVAPRTSRGSERVDGNKVHIRVGTRETGNLENSNSSDWATAKKNRNQSSSSSKSRFLTRSSFR